MKTPTRQRAPLEFDGSLDDFKARQAETSTPNTRLLIFIVLLLCGVGTFLISQLLLIHASIRLDESQSLWQTSHSVLGTLKVVAQDVHVPLYHLILHFWQIYVGDDIVSARLLSYLFFVATIPFAYLLARKVLSVRWALFAVALFSFSPFMNWYANEARMYTLLALLATANSYFFMNLVQSKGKKGWYGYAISAMLGIYSHYFFMFSLMAQAIYFMLNRRHFVKGTFKKLFFVAIILAVELAPWIYYFVSEGAAGNTSPKLPAPTTVDFFNAFSQFAFGFQTDQVNTVLVSTWPILVVVSLLGVKHGQKFDKKIAYIFAAALLPIIIAFVISFAIKPFFLSRYMTATVLPLIILVVWFVSHYRKNLGIIVAIALSGLLIVSSSIEYLSPATPVKEDYRSATKYLKTHAKPQDAVVLSAPFTAYPVQYYYHGPAAISTMPIWDRTNAGAIPAFDKTKLASQVKKINRDHQYVYLLLSYDQGYQETVYQYYQQHFKRVDSKKFSPDVNLYVYRVGYNQIKSFGSEK